MRKCRFRQDCREIRRIRRYRCSSRPEEKVSISSSTEKHATYSPDEVSAAVETDVSETLHNKGFSLHSRGKADHVHVFLRVAENVRSVVNTSSSGRNSTVNTSLRNGLSSDAARRVQISWVESGVLVRHPRHFALACVHVWRGNIDGRPEEAVL